MRILNPYLPPVLGVLVFLSACAEEGEASESDGSSSSDSSEGSGETDEGNEGDEDDEDDGDEGGTGTDEDGSTEDGSTEDGGGTTEDDESGDTADDGSGSTGDDSGSTGDDSGSTDDDTGTTGDDTGTTGDDTGTTGDDTGTTGDDSGTTGDDSGTTGDDSGTTGDDSGSTGDDSDTTGDDSGTTGDDSGTTGDAQWDFDPIYGLPNLDRDQGGSANDWTQDSHGGDDDLFPLSIPSLPGGHQVTLTLSGDTDQVRIWNGDQAVLGATDSGTVTSYTFDGGSTLTIEFADYLSEGKLTLTQLDASDQSVASDQIRLLASPLIINHHLQSTEQVWVVDAGTNQSMLTAYQNALGGRFTSVSGASYESDVWIQDELEFALSTAPDGKRLDTIIDSIRDRGLDPFPETLVTDDRIVKTWGTSSPDNPTANTYDSFGNLEVSPPLSNIGGKNYPFGRIYYGKKGSEGPTTVLTDFLKSQKVQAPVELDTTWLCVGHVDEFMAFIPDPSATKGFKLLYADIDDGYAIAEAMAASTSLPRYAASHSYSTVGAITQDSALRSLNEDLRDDHLLPILAQVKTAFGLDDSDIIKVPSIFYTEEYCDGKAGALVPGMVNLVVANIAGETPRLFIADPYFRSDESDQSSDPFISALKSRLPAGYETHFVDDWHTYHVGMGEVHCGTNVRRSPSTNWWTAALHLLN